MKKMKKIKKNEKKKTSWFELAQITTTPRSHNTPTETDPLKRKVPQPETGNNSMNCFGKRRMREKKGGDNLRREKSGERGKKREKQERERNEKKKNQKAVY